MKTNDAPVARTCCQVMLWSPGWFHCDTSSPVNASAGTAATVMTAVATPVTASRRRRRLFMGMAGSSDAYGREPVGFGREGCPAVGRLHPEAQRASRAGAPAPACSVLALPPAGLSDGTPRPVEPGHRASIGTSAPFVAPPR